MNMKKTACWSLAKANKAKIIWFGKEKLMQLND
jgi:hypothetical protein